MPYIDSITTDSAVLTQVVQMRRGPTSDPGRSVLANMPFPFIQVQSRLATEVNNWSQAAATVRSLGLLRDNWDGYGALAVSIDTVCNAEAILASIGALASFSAPEVTPTSSGTVSLSWETPATEAVLEIGITKYSGFVQTVGQPVIYLQGDAREFSYADSAMVVWSMQNHQAARPANAVSFGERLEDKVAA